jgi:hypothetical protein
MKITNRENLPAPLVSAISNDLYDKVGDISVSELPKAPRMRWLEIRHDDEIVVDASELIWRLIGNIGHKILERADTTNHLSEERMTFPVMGWVLSGKPDLLSPDMQLDDYKLTSVWAMKDEKTEWTAQLNSYAGLYRMSVGFIAAKLRITAILRDWSKPKAAREPDYPQVGVVVREVPLWSEEKQENYIFDRVQLHQLTAIYDDDLLPDCTDEERWAKPDLWAVKKKSGKKAIRGGIFDNETAAIGFVIGNDQLIVEHRPGSKTTRCDHYCLVSFCCSQYRALKAQKAACSGGGEFSPWS